MDKLKQNKVAVICYSVLLILVGILYLQNIGLERQSVYEKSIPDIDLSNIQYEFEYTSVPEDDDYSVNASGFVAFYDLEQQPKDLRQYYVINTDFESDLVSGRYVSTRQFTIEEIIKMPYLPPRAIGSEEMRIKSESDLELVLEDESGNMYIVNKQTEEITMRDVTGDETRLITNNNEFSEFIKDLF